MDTIELDAERLAAGQRYNKSLDELGLRPSALLWAFDVSMKSFVLVLITPLVDFAGPLSLSEKLFAAYRAAATPKEIDPFIVRLHSPKQAFTKALESILRSKVSVQDLDEETGIFGPAYLAHEKAAVTFGVEGLEIRPDWIYFFKHPKRDTLDLSRQWKRFSDNIDKIAA